ncbi:hypothetical protein GQR58_029698 [Nymphon striatum]|nr:hypothetical protein GQR58_029698 [Nymphon striatum]
MNVVISLFVRVYVYYIFYLFRLQNCLLDIQDLSSADNFYKPLQKTKYLLTYCINCEYFFKVFNLNWDFVFRKKDKAVTIDAQSTVKIGGEVVQVDLNLLFQRLITDRTNPRICVQYTPVQKHSYELSVLFSG